MLLAGVHHSNVIICRLKLQFSCIELLETMIRGNSCQNWPPERVRQLLEDICYMYSLKCESNFEQKSWQDMLEQL